jgi:hypothetical protein
MTFDPSAQASSFGSRQPISADELGALRSEVWANGSVSADEAEKLFRMNRTVAPSPDWTQFFVDAICEFLLSQGEPRRYLSDDEATWLLHQVSHDGKVESHAELELIVKLLETAEYAPPSLHAFALGVIEQTVLTGEGPTRTGDPVPNRIEDAEVAMIRRLIFAPAGEGPAVVSSAEAEMLFRLKDATLGHDNSPEWKKLFVQGVANHLMGHQSYVPPSAEEEMRLEAHYKSEPFGHMLSGLGQGLESSQEYHDALFGVSPELLNRFVRKCASEDEDEATDKFEHKVAADAEVTLTESDWLKRLYDKDRQRDEYEQALLDFLAEERGRPNA